MKLLKYSLVCCFVILYSVLLFCLAVLTFHFLWSPCYDREHFNCLDMSYGLAPAFHALGFDTRVVWGDNNLSGDEYAGHCWLSLNGVYFDATSFWFNDEKEYCNITYVDRYPYGILDEHRFFLDTYQED